MTIRKAEIADSEHLAKLVSDLGYHEASGYTFTGRRYRKLQPPSA